MLYVSLKVAHILAMSLFLGAGTASAVLKLRADFKGDLQAMKFAAGHIVWADWLFTIPSAVALPATGLWMTQITHTPLTSGWVATGILLYAIAGLCWLPAAFLQIKMHREILAAIDEERSLSTDYGRWSRIWLVLGFPSFTAAILTVFVMVTKNSLGL